MIQILKLFYITQYKKTTKNIIEKIRYNIYIHAYIRTYKCKESHIQGGACNSFFQNRAVMGQHPGPWHNIALLRCKRQGWKWQSMAVRLCQLMLDEIQLLLNYTTTFLTTIDVTPQMYFTQRIMQHMLYKNRDATRRWVASSFSG